MRMQQFKRRAARQKGFTLIELIIVIVIVGVLAAVAIPKYTSLTADAQQSATEGIAGSLASASATNYALRSAGKTGANTAAVDNCQDIAGLLQGGLPTGYTIGSVDIAAGASGTCTLTGPGTGSATFTGLGVS